MAKKIRHWRTWILLLSLCFAFLATNAVICSSQRDDRLRRHRRHRQVKKSTINKNRNSKNQQQHKSATETSTLTFEGSHTYTNPNPICITTKNASTSNSSSKKSSRWSLPQSNEKRILAFFQDPEKRDIIFSKGSGNPVQKVPMTPDLYQEWRTRCSIMKTNCGGANQKQPLADVEMLSIESTVSLIPGLSIKAISIMGCRLLIEPHSSFPMYELTLIKDEYVPVGAKPLVWVFNQITGNNHKHRKSSRSGSSPSTTTATSNRQTQAVTRISIHRSSLPEIDSKNNSNNHHDDNDNLFVRYYGHVKVSCCFPARLVKMLPMSKASLEAKVSRSIKKQIERESRICLDPFRDAMEEFLLSN